MDNELKFLRWFYENVDSALGPASYDVYEIMKEDYVAEGNILPDAYVEEE